MYVEVGERWGCVEPVVGRNNKPRPGYAVVDAEETHVTHAGADSFLLGSPPLSLQFTIAHVRLDLAAIAKARE
jgi:hypothetical protein